MDWILEEIRRSDHVLADETTFQVLKEPEKTAQSKSFLWALRREDPDHPLAGADSRAGSRTSGPKTGCRKISCAASAR